MRKLVKQDDNWGHHWEATSRDGSHRCSRCDLKRLTLGISESDLDHAITLSEPDRKYLYYFDEFWEGIRDLPTNLEVTCDEIMMRKALK
jgi:hypothetical protein